MVKIDSKTLDLLNELAHKQKVESFYDLVISVKDFEQLIDAREDDISRLGYSPIFPAFACSPRQE